MYTKHTAGCFSLMNYYVFPVNFVIVIAGLLLYEITENIYS